ncbi:MAG: LolA family protein [Sphingobacterium sp.]|uniref:LolA family protein n=1 Tax=Sphingobacterium sp. JB170 TaxID=1434842 RepID=UPI00097E9569|nr:outer membrane lipoprotein carrier protein LolA [Sphingobacterium sp. JB170]SJN31854.1 hypothetical protein FM107_07090 [Sphingobacterium sp. JB170]
MKHKIILIASFIWTTIAVFGQSDQSAKEILDRVSKKYDAYNTIQSEFNFSSTQATGDLYSDKGTLYLNKPEHQYRINLNSQDLLSDGKTTWSVLLEEKEVQVSPAEQSTTSIGPNNIFTFYKSGYNYTLGKNEKSNGKSLRVIELTPTNQQTNYTKIKLRVNENNHIHDVLIFDKSGAQYKYSIKTLYVNNKIPSTTFSFDKSKYPSYEIVDLR